MNIQIDKVVIPAGVFFVAAGLLFAVRGITFRLLHGWAARTEARIDDLVVKSLKTPSIY